MTHWPLIWRFVQSFLSETLSITLSKAFRMSGRLRIQWLVFNTQCVFQLLLAIHSRCFHGAEVKTTEPHLSCSAEGGDTNKVSLRNLSVYMEITRFQSLNLSLPVKRVIRRWENQDLIWGRNTNSVLAVIPFILPKVFQICEFSNIQIFYI